MDAVSQHEARTPGTVAYMEIITSPLECWKTASASTQVKRGEEEPREGPTPQRPGVHVAPLHMANGTQGSPSFWLTLQNAAVLVTTTKQGPAEGTCLHDCTTFIFLCHIHRPFLHLPLCHPHSSREARAEGPAAHLGLWSQRQIHTPKLD